MITELKKAITQNPTMKLIATCSEFKGRVGLRSVPLPSTTINPTLAIAMTAANFRQS